jgi:hypothetical protein
MLNWLFQTLVERLLLLLAVLLEVDLLLELQVLQD